MTTYNKEAIDTAFENYAASIGEMQSKEQIVDWFGNRGCPLEPGAIKLWSWYDGMLYIVVTNRYEDSQVYDTDPGTVDMYPTRSLYAECQDSISIEEYNKLPHAVSMPAENSAPTTARKAATYVLTDIAGIHYRTEDNMWITKQPCFAELFSLKEAKVRQKALLATDRHTKVISLKAAEALEQQRRANKGALKVAKTMVGEITSHGVAGHGKQWSFPAPADLTKLDTFTLAHSYCVEIKSSHYSDIKLLRARKIAAITLVLAGIQAERAVAGIEKLDDTFSNVQDIIDGAMHESAPGVFDSTENKPGEVMNLNLDMASMSPEERLVMALAMVCTAPDDDKRQEWATISMELSKDVPNSGSDRIRDAALAKAAEIQLLITPAQSVASH